MSTPRATPESARMPLELLYEVCEGANCNISEFARKIRRMFVADRLDWIIEEAECALRNAAIDQATRTLIAGLLFRDEVMNNDREFALSLAETYHDILLSIGNSGSRQSGAGMVYFIRPVGRPGCLKVGFSTSPKSRLRQLQTGSPEELALIGQFRGSQQDERTIHEVLADKRVSGEWFRLSDDDALHICSSIDRGEGLRKAVEVLA